MPNLPPIRNSGARPSFTYYTFVPFERELSDTRHISEYRDPPPRACPSHKVYLSSDSRGSYQLQNSEGRTVTFTMQSAAAGTREVHWVKRRSTRGRASGVGCGQACGAQHHAPQSYTSSKLTVCVSSTSTKKATLQPSACGKKRRGGPCQEGEEDPCNLALRSQRSSPQP